MKSLLLFVALMVVAMIVGLMIYLGAFKPVHFSVEEKGPYRMVFVHHRGAYHKIVPSIEIVERWAVANGEACVTSFGEYLDDPTIVDEDRLNSRGGCVVNKDWSKGLPKDLEYRELPKRNYLVAEFEGAPSIGPQKVYPKAQEYMTTNTLRKDGAVIEMYERLEKGGLKTRYHFPVK